MNKKIAGLTFALLATGFSNDTHAMAGRLRAAAARCAQGFKNVSKRAAYNTVGAGTLMTTAVAATAYQEYTVMTSAFESEFNALYDQGKSDSGPLLGPLVGGMKQVCREHGISDVAILCDITTPFPHIISIRSGDKLVLLVSGSAFNAWNNQLDGTPGAVTIEQLKAAAVHEIGHYKTNDSMIVRFFKQGLLHEQTRNNGAAVCALGAGLTAGMAAGKVLPTRGKTVFMGSLLLGLAAFQASKKITDFTHVFCAASKELEHRADRYVADTALKNGNPQLLDDLADFFEVIEKMGVPVSPVHPPLAERIVIARKRAAKELHEALVQEVKKEAVVIPAVTNNEPVVVQEMQVDPLVELQEAAQEQLAAQLTTDAAESEEASKE